MGATNSTLHYQLSQFISTDKPAWLQDYNEDMQKIDTGINGALTAAESAQNSADSASSGVSTLSDSVSALSTTVAGHTSDITDLSGDVNTIESLIGNGTPTAGDHTLIGAINANTNDINSSIIKRPDYSTATQDANYTNVTATTQATAQTIYTAVDDSYLDLTFNHDNAAVALEVVINDKLVHVSYATPNNYSSWGLIPLSSGDVVKVFASASGYSPKVRKIVIAAV